MKIWIDGACNPNPGHAGYGIHALTDDGRVIDAGDYLGIGTNNVAEHAALRAALQLARDEGAIRVEIISDSLLVVRQMNGQWRIKDPALLAILDESRRLAGRFKIFKINHVRREKNTLADALSKESLERRGKFSRTYPVQPITGERVACAATE